MFPKCVQAKHPEALRPEIPVRLLLACIDQPATPALANRPLAHAPLQADDMPHTAAAGPKIPPNAAIALCTRRRA